jgi:hypothetical protein
MAKSFPPRASKTSSIQRGVSFGVLLLMLGCGNNSSSGKNKNGVGPASEPGCTAAPACGSCTVCYEACLCQTGDATKCAAACPGGAVPGGGGGDTFGPGGGTFGTSGASGTGPFGAAGVGVGGTFGTGGFDVGGTPGTGGAGTGGQVGAGGSVSTSGGCGQTLPPIDDYGANGPYPTTIVNNTGPDGTYTVIRPTTLGANGFLHPPATWGNGITTNPTYYPGLLNAIASHGFVIVASNSTSVTAQLMTAGLDWLVAQNGTAGDYQAKLDTKCLITIGYSLGGGAAVGAGAHTDVVATVSMHGVTGNAAALHAPLLLFTSTMDTFVTASGFVTPTYNASTVQTFYATLTGAGDAGHLTPIGNAGPERAPMVAWLRLWAYGDQAARKYFDGANCILSVDPWGNPQKKNWK